MCAAVREDKSSLFRKANFLKADLEGQLESLAGQKSGATPSIAVQQKLAAQNKEFSDTVANLRQCVEEITDNTRVSWNRKTANLEDDVLSIQAASEKHLAYYFKTQKEEENRRNLFGDRTNKKDDDAMAEQLAERKGLREAGEALDNMIASGRGIVGSLSGQNSMLKNARKKLLEATNVIGVSSSLAKVIDRRQTGDKWLVYGGMTLTLFLLFSLWYLLR
eukprot:TRINITY_DN58106_c0_g1_i1.p1 TRINITY_DN58106_c0_g1~~TRINITY_DN58106_c0_g1_i1.p1  ORF type:complete len:220 (-),score=56.02 TRINITY_DN58106_c0_g1_i1:242-901(-)